MFVIVPRNPHSSKFHYFINEEEVNSAKQFVAQGRRFWEKVVFLGKMKFFRIPKH
jgi:hypothetical protein